MKKKDTGTCHGCGHGRFPDSLLRLIRNRHQGSSGGNRSSGFREQIRSKGRVQGRGRGCRKHSLIQGRIRRL